MKIIAGCRPRQTPLSDQTVTILEEMPHSLVPSVKPYCITGQTTSHHLTEGNRAGSKKEMQIIGDQHPCQTTGAALSQYRFRAMQKIFPVLIIFKDAPLFDSPDHHVMERSRCIQARSPWHGPVTARSADNFNNFCTSL
jgi:hypothetical protein